jgi:DNA-binding NarL/FixJ family response regulator
MIATGTGRVLIVEQSPVIARTIAEACEQAGLQIVAVAHDGLEAVNLALQHRPTHMTIDLILPRLGGIHVIEAIYRHGVPMSIVVISAVTARDPIVNAQKAGASAYLLKPLTSPRLVDALRAIPQPQPASAA